MKDPLADLVGRLRKSTPASVSRPQRAAPVSAGPAPASFLKSAGPGGLVFDFGPLTGNPMADNFTIVLNRFSEPVQESIARQQRQQFSKAMGDYVASGVDARESGVSAHEEWNKSLSKSFDEQTAEAICSGDVTIESGVPGVPSASPPPRGSMIKGQFNQTTMKLGGEQIVAQSETDAAVIEMMKSLQGSPDDGEYVIDETAEGI